MITKQIDNDVTTYAVRVFVRSKQNAQLRVSRHVGRIKNEAEAKRIEAKLKKECERELRDLESRGILFCDLLSGWYAYEQKVKVDNNLRTQLVHDEYLSSIKMWFGDYLKRPALDLNTFAVVNVFEEMKAKGRSFKHMRRIRTVLRTIFDYGIQSGLLPALMRSPTLEVVLKKEDEKKPEILTHAEITTLISKAYEDKHPWRYVWATALLTGMRSGELYALHWKDVDFENKSISVTRSYNGKRQEFKSTKAGYWRQVPISSELEVVLHEQQTNTGNGELVFERSREWEKGCQAKVLRQFCFLQGLPSIKFHALRACFATQMLRNGVEAARVMKICGWKDLKTMQCYVRLAGIEIEGATEALKLFTFKTPKPQVHHLPSLRLVTNEAQAKLTT